MASAHPEYNEFATCTVCGLKKFCRLDGKHFVCFSCDNGNFNGLKKINNKTKDNQQ